MYAIGERILLTLWVGGMWAIGYIAAPTLFTMLDDRNLAGSLAGRLFTIVSYLGIFCASVLIISQLIQSGRVVFTHWQIWVLITMLVIVVVGQFVLQPMMTQLRASGLEGEVASQFARLHGVSSILFLFNSLMGLVLVIFGLRTTA